jgi:tetratricopeptide (TPR) repeat protein
MPSNRKKNNSGKGTSRYQHAFERALMHEQRQQFNEAEKIYLALIREGPLVLQANLQLAELYRRTARLKMALPFLQNAANAKPNKADIHNYIGVFFHQLGHPEQAKIHFESALKISSGFLEARYNLGLALKDLSRLSEAIECFSEILAEQPNHVPSLLQKGISLREADKLKEAFTVLQNLLALDAESIDGYKLLALICVDLGRIDEAISCWEKVLQLNPACSLAYLHLSKLRDKHDRVLMEQFYQGAGNSIDKINMAFSLSKAFEDEQDYDKSFRYLLEGNRLKRMQFRYSIEEWRIFFEKLKVIFNADFLSRHQGIGLNDETPIFIVGMPRSGTSLVEQILASHPQVFGAGELKLLPSLCAQSAQQLGRPFPGFFQDLEVDEWRKIGALYLEGIRLKSRGARHITDKMPQNFRFIGLLSFVLPRAKIIHCQRDPLDTCWSIFKNIFAEGNPYAYDLEELGRFYNYYRLLMQHWHEVLPGHFYNLSYERLVEEPDVEIGKLLDFCELSFDSRCTDFHSSDRVVNTVSAAQVKRPINKDSVRGWSHFAPHLAPLYKELGGLVRL